ncbi:hypothetical protein HRbin36_02841 [bacterium HR36]|nr:hypothetical protein HRbin36_02841 [bacterium HR36]
MTATAIRCSQRDQLDASRDHQLRDATSFGVVPISFRLSTLGLLQPLRLCGHSRTVALIGLLSHSARHCILTSPFLPLVSLYTAAQLATDQLVLPEKRTLC